MVASRTQCHGINTERIYVLFILIFQFRQGLCNSRFRRDAPWNLVQLTDKQKLDILLHHNDLRRLTASSNMRYMSWDSELEWMAEEYSKNCNPQHSANGKHSRGWSVGKNVYVQPSEMSPSAIPVAIKKWYDEGISFNYKNRTCNAGKSCDFYTQIVWAKTFKVGCALATCNRLRNVYWNSKGSMLVCQYATKGNIIGHDKKLLPPYMDGFACSQCDKYDYCRDHLCANSARDFIGPVKAFDSQGSCDFRGIVGSIIFLVAVILALVAFTLYRERVRIMVRFGLWRAKRRPMQSHKFSNQNTPSTSRLNTPRHSVTALHGAHAVGSPLQRLKAADRFHSPNTPASPKHAPLIARTPPPTRLPPPVPPLSSRNK